MALPRFQPRRFQPRLLLGPGTRATEGFLLAELDRLLAESEEKPALLARPVRVVVPSRSLRLHLASTVVRHRRRAAAGLLIQTHFHLALELIERAGETLETGRWLAELVPERLARQQTPLARPLAALADGFAAVLPTVRDLLDARFEPAHLEALDEALEQEGPQVATLRQVARARALLEVAAETFHEIERAGLGTPARLLTRAADLLEARGEALLPARAVLLHGYADATGVVTDLVQALQRRFGAWVLLDRPADPARPDSHQPVSAGPEGRFGEAFVERLTHTASPEPLPEPRDGWPAAPEIRLFAAQGTAGEVREVARRLARELEDGVRPESLAVVARDLTPYRRELRHRFELLGVPFSALGEGGAPTPAQRRARAVVELLHRGGRTPTEAWIEALERLPTSAGGSLGGSTLLDLRLGLAALGAGRLDEVQALDLDTVLGERAFLPLPVRQGIRSDTPDQPDDGELGDDAEDGDDRGGEAGKSQASADLRGAPTASGARVLRRTLDRRVLDAAVTAAARLLSILDHWPDAATPAEHRERLERLLHRELGWPVPPAPAPGNEPPPRPLHDALRQLDDEAPAGFRLDAGELHRLLSRILDAHPGSRLGGQGGGVQVLTVTEARSRTFEHLYLLGCNRGVFPRPIREDPLLPDELRRVLRVRAQLLPDLPIKDVGFDEERYLFAQLLSASPRVTLSWQHLDDTGALRPPSPLVERLGLDMPTAIVARDGAALARTAPAGTPEEPVPAGEAAIRVALEGTRRQFREVLPVATAAVLGDRALSPVPPERLAAARLAVLDEQDPDLATPEGRAASHRPGPYLGWVGPLGDGLGDGAEGDPRHRELWVTTMERLAGCPWQVFLTKLLGLEPAPDPLTALPGIDALLLGRVVHTVLEDLVIRPAGPTVAGEGPEPLALEALHGRSPVRTPWPDQVSLDELLATAARTVLLDEGLALPGLTRALARAARPYLDGAREADWIPEPPAVLGVEVLGRVELQGSGDGRPLRFRADRVDLDPGTGALVLTDYKTGRPPRNNGNEGKKPETRRGYLLRDVRAGTRLQAVAYALAGTAWGEGMPAVGRYLFLRPDTEHRDRTVGPWDGDFEHSFAPAFHAAVGAALGAWDEGTFFPRVVDPQGDSEPVRCSWCPVAEACVRGDSGARLRLADHARRRGLVGADTTETAQLALWWLGQDPPPPTEDGAGETP